MIKLGFIGTGTVGSALAHKLNAKGYRVVAVSSKSGVSAQKLAAAIPGCRAVGSNQEVADAADLIFITTPDAAIGKVVAEVGWHAGQSVVHCSGADSVDVLKPAERDGARVGGFHPLQTFAGIKQAIANLPGSTFAIEAEEPLESTLREMAAALDCHWIKLGREDKVLYHAAAVIACNYMVTLTKLASDLWETFGVPREQAVRALIPLLRGTLNNIESVGVPGCLTGPIARGDTGTVKKHLRALEKSAPGLLAAYRELGRQTIPIAFAKGKLERQRADELEAVLEEPERVEGATLK